MRCNTCCEFVVRKTKALSLIHYITDYQTKLSNKTYHRVAFAAGLRAKRPMECNEDIFSQSKRFIIQTFNKLATNRETSAVEIAHVTLGYPEFYSNKEYRTISLIALYATMKYKFPELSYIPSEDIGIDDQLLVVDTEGKEKLYFQSYQNRCKVLLPLCLYDFISIIHINKGSGFSVHEQYFIPSFTGPLPHHEYYSPEGRSRYSALMLGLFLPWHIIPIIALNVVHGKSFEKVLSYWLQHYPVPARIRNLINNCELLRKSAKEVDEDHQNRKLEKQNTGIEDGMAFGEELLDTGTYTNIEEENISMETLEADPLTTTNKVIFALDSIMSGKSQQSSIDILPLSKGDNIISNIIRLYLKNEIDMGYEISQESNEGMINKYHFPTFENSMFSEWKSCLKGQEENKLFLACGGGTGEEVLENPFIDLEDVIEPEPQSQQSISETTNLVSQVNLPTWSKAVEQTIIEFSLNNKQREVLYLTACGLNGALSSENQCLLVYCGGEGGTGKSRVIFSIRRLFELMKLEGNIP